jgi:phasin family protein
MSEAKPKRTPRESGRGNGIRSEATAIEPVESVPFFTPETATAAVALETAVAADAIAEPLAEPTEPSPKPAAPADDPWAVWTESQSALAHGFEALATEVTGLTRSGIVAATDAAKAMLGARTLAEAIEINAGFARRSFDVMIGGGAKLSEIGVKAATEASRPILNRLGEGWNSLRALY